MRPVTRVLRAFAKAFVAIIVLLVVLLPVAAWFIFGEGRFMGTTFTPTGWAKAGSCIGLTDWKCEEKRMRCERGRMLRSLTRNHLVVGKVQRAEAITLLGADFVDRKRSGQNCMSYALGYCSGFGFDYDYFELCFNGSGLLTSRRRYQS